MSQGFTGRRVELIDEDGNVAQFFLANGSVTQLMQDEATQELLQQILVELQKLNMIVLKWK